MLLLLFYYGLNLFGIRVDAWTAAILAFTLRPAPSWWRFGAAAFRPCRKANGMPSRPGARLFAQLCGLVIFPQARRMALPPTVGYMVQVVKGTSLAALIGFTELARAGTQVNTMTFEPDPLSSAPWR